MSKEIAAAASTDMTQFDDSDWGVEVSARNIVIPKIMLMQGLSEAVIEGGAKLGDLYNSLTKKVVGDTSKSLELIPFFQKEMWYIFKVVGKDETFLRIEDLDSSNVNWRYEDFEGDMAVKRIKVLQFYCIDPSNPDLPVIVSFKGKSMRTGQELYTMMYFTNRQENKFPPSYHILLSSVRDKNEKGTFAKYTFKRGDESTSNELKLCLEWINTIKSGKAKDAPEEAKEPEQNPAF